MTKHKCTPENAKKFWDWIHNRGGIVVWKSINLSNPGTSWSAPLLDQQGKELSKPNWQCSNTPEQVITDPDKVVVITGKEVKRFRVGLRQKGMYGLVLTDGAQRNLDKALDKAGEESWFVFDYFTQEAVIFVPFEKVSLVEFISTMETQNV